MPWHTRFTQQFPCSLPIMGAPMANVSSGHLAAETYRAGALGSIAAGHYNTDEAAANLEREVEKIRKLTSTSIRDKKSAPLVVGFIGHSTFASNKGWTLVEDFISKHRPEVVQYFGPAVVTRANGVNNIDLAHKYECKVVTQVGTEADAQEALDAGSDCIVAQGSEAGGHGCRSDVGSGTLALAARIVSLVRSSRTNSHIPVLAAGGIVDGRGLAAALALGCDGAVIGTRLWASIEAAGHVANKERLAEPNIGPDQVIRTPVMDIIQNSFTSNPWPEPFDSSGLVRNPTIENWHGRDLELNNAIKDSVVVEKFKLDNGEASNVNEAYIYSGKGVGDITSIDYAYNIIRRVDEEAAAIITDLPKLLNK